MLSVKTNVCLILIIILTMILTMSHFSFADEDDDFIIIDNPSFIKIPIAIPLFKAMNGLEAEAEAAAESTDLLSDALSFTGYFRLIDKLAFIEEPHITGIETSKLNFRNWTGIGAEKLVTGGIVKNDDIIEMELRLFDAVNGRMILGKRYKGFRKDLRYMIHKFAGLVMMELTGKSGVFGSKIAFESTTTGTKEIYSSEFDGFKPKRETFADSISLSPSWSHDGNWIAYTSYKRGKPDLYIKNIKEKRGSIASFKGANLSPSWMPNKPLLAASLSFSGDPEIYLLDTNARIKKQLTKSWGIDISPDFSPNGNEMVFVSRRSGTPQLYIKDLKTNEVERLTFMGKYNTSPSWSPDGEQVAFVGMRKNKINIFVIQTDGSNLRQLTQDSGDNESPSWSPDGSMIAFSSSREGGSKIYVMTAYGTDQRRLLDLEGIQANPEWSPVIEN